MDFIATILSALLFVAFVPGVLITLPSNGSRRTVLIVHAALFALTVHFVMSFYWTYIRERFGNYGAPGCPACFVENANGVCVPDPSCSGPSSQLPRN